MSPLPTAEAHRAADQLAYWCHVGGPLDLWQTYEVLTDGLVAAKQDYREAVARHDHDQAQAIGGEITDLNLLCATMAAGLAQMRLRYFASDRPWPLTRL